MDQQKLLLLFFLPIMAFLVLLAGLGQTAVGATDVGATDIAAPETADNLPDWGDPVPLTQVATSPNGASQPSIAASAAGPTITVLFNRQMEPDGSNNDPWFRRSVDNGATWSALAPIFSSEANSAQTAIVVDDQEVAHAVWREGNGLAYAAESAWGTNIVRFLSTPPQDQIGVSTPAIASGQDGLMVTVWSEKRAGNPDIYFVRSGNGGQSWESVRTVEDTQSSSLFPDVVIDQNNITHVVWQEHDQAGTPGQPVPGTIYYTQSTAMGWSTPVNLTQVRGVADGRRPQILLTATGIQVAFTAQSASDTVLSSLQHVSCAAQCGVSLSWQASPAFSAGFFFESDTAIRPALGQYQGCPIVYFHGQRLDMPEALSSIWGGSGCDNGQVLDQVIFPPAQAISPQIANNGSQWTYMVYESVGAPNQVFFLRNGFKMFLPYVGCAIDATPATRCGFLQ